MFATDLCQDMGQWLSGFQTFSFIPAILTKLLAVLQTRRKYGKAMGSMACMMFQSRNDKCLLKAEMCVNIYFRYLVYKYIRYKFTVATAPLLPKEQPVVPLVCNISLQHIAGQVTESDFQELWMPTFKILVNKLYS